MNSDSFLKVVMPNTEIARVLIMEYVEGRTLQAWTDEYLEGDPATKLERLNELNSLVSNNSRLNRCAPVHLIV